MEVGSDGESDSVPTRDLDPHDDDRTRREGMDLQYGDVLDGVYEVTGLLGSGGMGTVYLARDLHLEREVAIKMIHREKLDDRCMLDSFFDEARIMARVQHPNVVTIYAMGARAGRPYLVMEHVPGHNLSVWQRHRERLTPCEAIAVLDPLCRGVQAIHDVGTIHRDLKPSNVLVGQTLRVAVTDFGLARSVDRREVSGPALLAGTPAYLAPEIVRGDPLRSELATRIDIYAVAVMAYELLTGRPPFPGPTLPALLHQHGFIDPRPPSQVRPGLSPAFDAPLLQGLAKAPGDRPPSAEALRQALEWALRTASCTAEPLRVLLVDDEPAALGAVRELLQLSFAEVAVTSATDAASALVHAQRETPDIVITDLHMPCGGGAALIGTLREREPTRNVPIVVVTAYGGAADWRMLRESGADRFLVKPLDFDTLIATVRSLTGRDGR